MFIQNLAVILTGSCLPMTVPLLVPHHPRKLYKKGKDQALLGLTQAQLSAIAMLLARLYFCPLVCEKDDFITSFFFFY